MEILGIQCNWIPKFITHMQFTDDYICDYGVFGTPVCGRIYVVVSILQLVAVGEGDWQVVVHTEPFVSLNEGEVEEEVFDAAEGLEVHLAFYI